jgi:hypothetical protein
MAEYEIQTRNSTFYLQTHLHNPSFPVSRFYLSYVYTGIPHFALLIGSKKTDH